MDLQTLIDRAEINDLLTRYARAVDRQDWDLFRSVFTSDARIDYTQVGGIAGSVDETVAFLAEAMTLFDAIQHLISNVEIALDGDEATVTAMVYNPLQLARHAAVGHRRVVPPRAGAHARRLAQPVADRGGRLVRRCARARQARRTAPQPTPSSRADPAPLPGPHRPDPPWQAPSTECASWRCAWRSPALWRSRTSSIRAPKAVKVENPSYGDQGRYIGVVAGGISALFQVCNRGKRSIAVNCTEPRGRDIVLELCASADVFVQNMRPGVVERLGLGYDDVSARNADIVYASISGFGPDGPYAHRRVYDSVIQAQSGLVGNQTGLNDEQPRFLRQAAADKITSYTASQAITAALFARERGAGGQHIELSMLDASVAFLFADSAAHEVALDNEQPHLAQSFSAHQRAIAFSDGHAVVAAVTDDEFHGMARAFGIDTSDPRDWPRCATASAIGSRPATCSARCTPPRRRCLWPRRWRRSTRTRCRSARCSGWTPLRRTRRPCTTSCSPNTTIRRWAGSASPGPRRASRRRLRNCASRQRPLTASTPTRC